MIKRLGAVAALVCLTACSAPSLDSQIQYGSARLSLAAQDARSVQFLTGDIQAIRVTVTEVGDNVQIAQASFTGAALASHMTGNAFSFTVDNLKVKDGAHPSFSYTAKVEAFLDAGLATAIGESVSTPFSVSVGPAATSVGMPNLVLAATPVGGASGSVTIVDTPAPGVVIR
ncbi:hypothetical protein J7643_15255 [bacterium]|nr:hypothetical protein [bacterium]